MNFGKTPDGTAVELYELKTGKLTVKVMTYGATITEIDAPTATANRQTSSSGSIPWTDTSPRSPTSAPRWGGWPTGSPRAKFTLGGHEYSLATNDGPNSLHGGIKGFDKVVWKAEPTSLSERTVRQADVPQS